MHKCACMCSVTSFIVWLFATPWTVARQAPLSIGFSRQEYWSGLPCPPSGDLPGPGIEPSSPASPTVGRFFTTEPSGKTLWMGILVFNSRTLSWGLYFRRISGQRMLCMKWDPVLCLPLLLYHYAGTMSHDLKEMGLWLSCFRLVGSDCYSGFSKGSAVRNPP